MLAFAISQASKKRTERGNSSVDPGLKARLLAKSFERRHLVRTRSASVQISHSSGIPQSQIGGLVISMRAAQAKGSNRGHDQLWVDCLQAGVVQPQARHLDGMIIVEQNIRVGEQAPKDFLS